MNGSRPRPGARLRTCLVLPVLALLVGCGGTGTVSGTVSSKAKSKKLVAGTVMVMAKDGTASYGTINADGTYKVENVPTGPARVTVSSPDPKAAGAAVGRGGAGLPGKPTRGGDGCAPAPPSDDVVKGWFPIADKYGDVNNSGLSLDVKKGDNPLNIDLD